MKGFCPRDICPKRDFFLFPKYITAFSAVHYSKVNIQKHKGVGTWFKNYPLNRGDRYMKVLF